MKGGAQLQEQRGWHQSVSGWRPRATAWQKGSGGKVEWMREALDGEVDALSAVELVKCARHADLAHCDSESL